MYKSLSFSHLAWPEVSHGQNFPRLQIPWENEFSLTNREGGVCVCVGGVGGGGGKGELKTTTTTTKNVLQITSVLTTLFLSSRA